MDIQLFRMINGLSGHFAWLDTFMVIIALYTPVLLAVILALLYLSFRERYQKAALLAGIAALLALGIGQIVGWEIHRARPYAYAIQVLISRTNDVSFPSDHATLAFAIAALLWHYHRKLSFGLFALGVLLGFSRVFVGAHYPLDVLGGAVLGSLVGWGVGWLSLRSPWKEWIQAFFAYLSSWHLAVRPGG